VSYRVFEIAAMFNTDSKNIIEILKNINCKAANRFSSVDNVSFEK